MVLIHRSSAKNLFLIPGDDHPFGIKNQKGAEGAGMYKHMAGGGEKRETEEQWKNKCIV